MPSHTDACTGGASVDNTAMPHCKRAALSVEGVPIRWSERGGQDEHATLRRGAPRDFQWCCTHSDCKRTPLPSPGPVWHTALDRRRFCAPRRMRRPHSLAHRMQEFRYLPSFVSTALNGSPEHFYLCVCLQAFIKKKVKSGDIKFQNEKIFDQNRPRHHHYLRLNTPAISHAVFAVGWLVVGGTVLGMTA